MMKSEKMRLLFLLVLSIINLNALNAQSVVRVAAAANLRYAMAEIAKMYEAEVEEVKVEINYGASGTFYQQIVNGAPYDLFLSADDIFPMKLQEQELTTGECHIYACGKLALYGLRDNIDNQGMTILTDSAINRIAIANPRTAPYGSRSLELLKSLGLWDELEHKIVYGDSIAQTAQFAITGNSDLGFVALSLLLNPEADLKGSYYIIPEEKYKQIAQSGVLIKQKSIDNAAAKFFEYILSSKCHIIWDKYGYTTLK